MAKAPQKKITLSPSRDIPFDRLVLSQSNVRRVKAGVSIGELAQDIVRRTLLQSLNVRPILDGEGQETGMFEVPAGGRRYRALELLVKQKRLARDAAVPCIVQAANDTVAAEEDSLAENTFREQLHPLDQFRGMKALADRGDDVEAIAAHFMTTPAVVRQRLRLASVSPRLHEIYAGDGMTLDQLMAFAVCEDHARQEEVWKWLENSYNKSPAYIRQKLTEESIHARDKRVRFVGVEAYLAAGGGIMRDLFEPDDGGWLTDPALIDRLVDEKLRAEGERIGAEGWKWVAVAVDLPWSATQGLREIDHAETAMTPEEETRLEALQAEMDDIEAEWADESDVPEEIHARITAIETGMNALETRPVTYDPEEMARAGVFVSIDGDGGLRIEAGYVRPEDEPVVETGTAKGEGLPEDDGSIAADPSGPAVMRTVVTLGGGSDEDDDADEAVVKPLPDRLVSELTAWRTLALQDAFAQNPSIAFAAVLHAMVLQTFYHASQESCLQIRLDAASFGFAPASLRDSGPARAIAERHARWNARLPDAEADLWDALAALDGAEQASLFAHCASKSVNAQQEVAPKYDNGRISVRQIERRIAHSHVLARAVGLDMVGAGWRPTVEGYFRSITKPRILADVAEAKGSRFAEMIDHLKKGDMANEAERLMEDAGWLPEVLRTPDLEPVQPAADALDESADALPAFLDDDAADLDEIAAYAIAAE